MEDYENAEEMEEKQKKQGSVSCAFKVTKDCTKELEDVSKRLEKELEPLLKKVGTIRGEKDESQEEKPMANFAVEIIKVNRRLSGVLYTLDNIIDRLDL